MTVRRALLAILLLHACGDDLAASADANASVWPEERTFELPGGGLVEAELEMARGDSVDVEYQSRGGEVAWDVHIHDGDEVRTEAQGRDQAGAFTFVADQAGTYWSSWLNVRSSPLEIRVRFSGHGSTEFRGWL